MQRQVILRSWVSFWACCTAACGGHSGVVSGAQDAHCNGVTTQPASAYSCVANAASADSGATDYGATMYNASGNDDDCKWRVTWSSTDVAVNKNVTFTVAATWLSGGGPVTGANPQASDVFLNTTHPAPNTASTTTEDPKGTYKIGPVLFDAKGQWTVRFHFFETCADTDHSLHGHAAFYVDVP